MPLAQKRTSPDLASAPAPQTTENFSEPPGANSQKQYADCGVQPQGVLLFLYERLNAVG